MVLYDLLKTTIVLLTIFMFIYTTGYCYGVVYDLGIIPKNFLTTTLYAIRLDTLITSVLIFLASIFGMAI